MRQGLGTLITFFLLFTPVAGSFVPDALAKENRSLISKEAFLSSDFPHLFKKREFQKALEAIDHLIKKYPDDPLLLRYRALTLDKLGRHEEAITAYQEILSRNPNHVPTHLFLGLAYARAGKSAEAAKELRWVADHSASDAYRHWAEAQLSRIRHKKVSKKVAKKPYLFGKTGVSYDSNPLLIPDDKSLSSRSKEDGVDFPVDLTLGYPLVLGKEFRLDALYISQTVLHDGGAEAVDFTSHGFALNAKKRTFFGKRTFLLGGRYDLKTNFLRSDLFSVINRFLLSADTSFWRRTRTHTYGRFSYSNYGPDGSTPTASSRDGFRGGLGLVQYFYTTADFKSYLFAKQEVSFAETRGDNFDRVGSLTRLGLHGPLKLVKRTDYDLSSGFDYGTYPEFASLSTLDLSERKDLRVDAYSALTYQWRPNLATRGFYRFIHSGNDNDFFDRNRHIAGMEVIFSL